MSLIIFTKSPSINFFSFEIYKFYLRKFFKRQRGPSAVTKSLLRGFDNLNVPYTLNPSSSSFKEKNIFLVNESVEALKWVIRHKKEGDTIITLPNIVITPLDHNEIICNKKIDIILQPSDWTKNFLSSIKPGLESKIKIWPSGVEVPVVSDCNKTIDVLIYNKNSVDEITVEKIELFLQKKDLRYEIITYGHFMQADYFKKLEKTKMMIYLSHSESQGLSLQEAWVRNVPTLVYNRGYYDYNGHTFFDPKISAPYLSEQTGVFFKDNFEEEFLKTWLSLENFTPRKYVTETLSDEVCAKKFLKIISDK